MHHAILQDLNIRNLQQQQRPRRIYNPRVDPTEVLTDFDFKRHFRFNKENARVIADLLELDRPSDRGLPLTPIQSLCLALNHYAGSNFTRVSAYCGNVSYHAGWTAIDRVTDALCEISKYVIKLPTLHEMELTSQRMCDKYHLPGFAYAVDGMFVRFDGAPRGIPVGPGLPNLQNFFTRKMFYGINVMVLGNDKRLILALDVDWHGAAHDARVWKESPVKELIERHRNYYLAGDSAYPISDVLVKPYPTPEVLADNSGRKRLFNARLCGLRTEMSENVFGIWKRRFPCLRNMRSHYEKAKKMVIATAVLHNLAILLNEDDLEDELEFHEQPPDEQYVIVEDLAEPDVVRERGKQLRDTLRDRMPPRHRRERVV
jgi:DDE superfamily endonuclease